MAHQILKAFAAAASIVAGAGLSASPAVAGPAAFECGAPIISKVKTDTTDTINQSTAFENVSGAAVSFVVPQGETRCIKVRFSATVACFVSSTAFDQCSIRARDGGAAMHPEGGDAISFVVEDDSTTAHAFEWVRRVGAGTHNITIQWRVHDNDTIFALDDWTLDAELTR